MNVLLLSEGDPETADAWSGIAQQVVRQLRAAGHAVAACDVDLSGWDRWFAAARVFSPNRNRFGVKYRLLAEPSRRRSRRAGKWIAERREQLDLIFQVGATFRSLDRGQVPYVLYCDSNIGMAVRGLDSGHSPAQWLTPAELAVVRARELDVYKEASLIFTISNRLRASFIEDFGVDARRVRTVHAGPNFDVSRIPERAKRRTGPPTVLFVGGQFERKGGDTLLAAFRLVRQQVPDARLVIIGPEERVPEGSGAEWLGYLNKDTPAGWQALVDAYERADIFCLPTRFEPFGIVYLEAMFFGLPCIGTTVGAVPEMIEDGVTGYTIAPNDEQGLARRLTRLLLHPEEAASMGSAGRARATSYFTWSATVERMLGAIDELGVTAV